jgi:3-hydroxyacyl-[acyl-carrier-protein] dehydratase
LRFILVDEILELSPGKFIKAIKKIAPDEDYFQDHFPGFPVVPGVLLTEMMAQASGKCLDSENPDRGKAMLAKINSASFRDWVRPGQTVVIHAQVKSSRLQFATTNCYIELGQNKLCSAELFFGFMAMNQFAVGYKDEVLERFLNHGAKESV